MRMHMAESRTRWLPLNMRMRRAEFQNKMDAIKQYLVFRKVGDDLENRHVQFVHCTVYKILKVR